MANSERVGIQGLAASNTDAAAKKIYGTAADIAYYATFPDVFESLHEEKTDKVVVAFANPNINENYGYVAPTFNELRMRGAETWITQQTILWIRHKLLTVSGATPAEIAVIHTQNEARIQCTNTLDRDYPNAHVQLERDTALSAKIVHELGDHTHAAIATTAAAELYGLATLHEDMQNTALNPTQFVSWLPRQAGLDAISGEENQTYMWVRVPDPTRPAALEDNVLDILKANAVNLSDIHSAYIPGSLLEKEFYLQADAGYSNEAMQQSLKEMERQGCLITVLGSCVKPALPPIPA